MRMITQETQHHHCRLLTGDNKSGVNHIAITGHVTNPPPRLRQLIHHLHMMAPKIESKSRTILVEEKKNKALTQNMMNMAIDKMTG